VYLRLDDLRSPDQPVGVYGVYVNVPDNDPNTPDDHYAGSFFPFGIGGDHPPMNAVLDITELYQRLNERGQWGPRVDVRFVPRDVEPPSGPLAVDEANEPPGTLHVGQVSVHFQ
jgi:tyrosinase